MTRKHGPHTGECCRACREARAALAGATTRADLGCAGEGCHSAGQGLEHDWPDHLWQDEGGEA